MITDVMRVGQPATLESLYLDQQEVREPGAGEVLVRVHASSLNFHDYAVVMGRLPVQAGRIPLSDGAGEVLLTGTGCEQFSVGDKVLSTFFTRWHGDRLQDRHFETVPGDGMDGYASRHVVAPESFFTRMPRDYDYSQAATLPCAALTAWRALIVNGAVKAGDTVLIQGTGGVSLFALQIAKMAGARVIATSSSDAKLERLHELGADHVINYRSTPQWGVAAAELSGTGGVDHVVEIGGVGTLPESINAVRNGGHIALIGAITGREGPVPTAQLMRKQIRLIGLTVGNSSQQLELIEAFETHAIRPLIDSTYPLECLADAFRHQASGQHFGKICIAF